MKVVAIQKDWKACWNGKDIAKCCRLVGGDCAMQEITHTGFDGEVMIFCSKRDVNFEKLWDAGDMFLCDKTFQAPTLSGIIKKIQGHVTIERKRDVLWCTASDHWSGGALDKYRNKVQKMLPAGVNKEWKKCFGDAKVEDLEG